MNIEETADYVVKNENTFGFLLPDQPGWMDVIARIKDGANWMDGPVLHDGARPANRKDFDTFRVNVPKNWNGK